MRVQDFLSQGDTWRQSRPVFHGTVIVALVTDQGGLDIQIRDPRNLAGIQADLPGFIAWLTATFT